jgi:iron complex outermembrane recepter protein
LEKQNMPLQMCCRLGGKISLIAVAVCLGHASASAQMVNTDIGDSGADTEIVVTAARIRGAVATDVPPVAVIDAKDIASYGASSVTDLVAAIAPQTGSGRGRGGGQPVVLLNGQRISGFRELRDLPPEAIKQVQVFPEEVALQYGYRPDQRVINFILQDNFASVSAEIEGGVPEDGGYSSKEFETTLTNIGKTTRLNLNAEYQQVGDLTESQRGISSDNGNDISGNDSSQYRTLLPRRDVFEVNGSWSKILAPQTNLSLNANYSLNAGESQLGLPFSNFLVPATSPFSQTGSDAVIGRSFLTPGPLTRDTATDSAKFGLSFNTLLDTFSMSFTANYENTKNETRTVRGANFAALQAGVADGTINPFASGFGDDLIFLPADSSDSRVQILDLANTLAGELLRLPSGPVRITVRSGYGREVLDSAALRSGVSNEVTLKRNNLNAALNIEIPLVERDFGALGFLGEVAINGNYGIADLSDFGTLTEYTAGIRWSPVKELSFQASIIGDENAPGIAQLGNPLITTPNVSYFDFTRNETALINVTSGGNAALTGEKRRDLKFSVNWAPPSVEGLNMQVEYFRNRSSNTTASFPLLTPEIEAAFPGRVTRDSAGRLLRIDQRPVNFAEERSQKIRSGFNFSGGIGPQQRGGPGGAGAGGRDAGAGQRGDGVRGVGRPQTATPGTPPVDTSANAAPTPPAAPPAQGRGAAGPGGFGRGGFGGPGGPGGGGGRWQISLYHSYQIQDEVLIAAGVPRLDLLNGSATSSLGGTPRHQLELSGGVFFKGLGTRITGNYRSATRADGSGLPGSSDLRFSDLTTLNLRFFLNFDDRGNLTKNVPFLKGSRVAFSINNALDDVIDVRDQNGLVPVSYLPGYLDPTRRFYELSFRKRF